MEILDVNAHMRPRMQVDTSAIIEINTNIAITGSNIWMRLKILIHIPDDVKDQISESVSCTLFAQTTLHGVNTETNAWFEIIFVDL